MIFNEGYGACPDTSYITRARGTRQSDNEGRELIDLALGGGSMILGHANPEAAGAIERQAGMGTIYAAPHRAVHEADKLLDDFIPWLPGRVWCNSGSEAVMRLIRIARAVTGKRKIALFSGCWHGSWDGTLVEEDYTRTAADSITLPVAKLRSAGIPPEVLDSIVFLPYNDELAFEMIADHRNVLACVLIEPVQGSNPRDDIRQFLHGLRTVTAERGMLLAFDEVVTGFRLARGGGQECFGVHADLAAYGKILGGGLPVGMVAGTQAIMDKARAAGVFFGGTFSANPLTIAASLATLRRLHAYRLVIYSHLEEAGSLLRDTVNAACLELNLPARMIGCNSISRLLLTGQTVGSRRERDQLEPPAAVQDRFYSTLRDRGLHIGANRILFLSAVHDVADVMTVAGMIVDAVSKFGWKGE
jgi:glutamate-1-semialdehyde 2,1-aminomutase